MAQRALAEVAERLHLGIRIVNAFDHGILIGRAAASLLGVELKRLVKAKQRVLLNTGHELIARRLNGGMQRNGKRELLGDIGKFANTGNAGGESDTDIIHGEGTAQSQRLRESQIPMFGKFFLLPER